MDYNAPDAYERLIAPRYAPVADAVIDLAPPQPGDAVLEVGAGTGLVTRRLASLLTDGATLVATDRSEQMLTQARGAIDTPGVAFLMLDYNEPLPFLDASFNLVVSGLTYVQDSSDAVAELARVLKPGGRVALSMWGSEYLELELMNRAKAALGDDLITAPDPRAAAARFAAAGFEEIELMEVDFNPRYEDIDEYLAYRRGFGVPVGQTPEAHERYLEALGAQAASVANADGSFTQGWRFALIRGVRG